MFTNSELKTILKFNIFTKDIIYDSLAKLKELTLCKYFVISASNPLIKDIWSILEIFAKYSPDAIVCLCFNSTNLIKIKKFVDCYKFSCLKLKFFLIPESIINYSLENNDILKIEEFLDEYLKNKELSNNLKLVFRENFINKLYLIPNLVNYEILDSYRNNLNETNLGIIVQARMSSTRLPGKAMLEIGGLPVILHILSRFAMKFGSEKTILSTSNNVNDNHMAEYIKNKGFNVFRGDEENLSSRFLDVASNMNFTHVVRVTGDDLFRNINSIDSMFKQMIKNNVDYIFSDDLILGCNSEIMNIESLKFIKKFAKYPFNTNALTWYLDRNDIFKIKEFYHNLHQRFSISLMLDERKDYESFLRIWSMDENFFTSLWCYDKLLLKLKKNLELFNFHPSDIGLNDRDNMKYSFIFD